MTMERWRPERGLVPRSLARELEEMEERFWGDIFGRGPMSMWRRFPRIEREWVPAVDVFEREDKLVVKAELPGMKIEDIAVSLLDNVLTVKG
jgi:HSP20 family protein